MPGDGEPRKEFVIVPGRKAAEPDVDTDLTAQKVAVLMLSALILHGVQVLIIDRKLTSKGVTFAVAIGPRHRELVKGDMICRQQPRRREGGLDGGFLGGASEWINGGIRILPGDKGEMKASYHCMPIRKRRWRTAQRFTHHNREF